MVKSNKKLRVLETFSGIGAQHIALNNLKKQDILDFEIVGTSEWNVYATLSYASIHYPNFLNEIKDPTKEELALFKASTVFSSNGKEVMKNINYLQDNIWSTFYKAFKITNNIGTIVNSYDRIINQVGDYDLLTYSFPCQDLSTAGNFHGFNEGIQEHTRSGLLLEIEKLLKKHKKTKTLPKYLLLENVTNLVQKQHRNSFDEWLTTLSKMGYVTIWGILDSHKYGFIQKRRRVFALSILANKKSLGWKDKIRDDLDKELENIFDNEYKPSWMQTIEEVIDFDNKNKHESQWAQIKNTPSRIRMINNKPTITKETNKISTVTTKQDRLPNCGDVIYKNKRQDKNGIPYTNNRFITPMEAYKLMGFKETDYAKAKQALIQNGEDRGLRADSSAREKLYNQAGNSIVINVLELIFFYLDKVGDN